MSVCERIAAMALHTSLSILVFESARIRGRIWLYPVCVFIHAAFDMPAAAYQVGLMSLSAVYVLMAAGIVVSVLLAVMSYKRQKIARTAQVSQEEN